jgi:hypothetical protein
MLCHFMLELSGLLPLMVLAEVRIREPVILLILVQIDVRLSLQDIMSALDGMRSHVWVEQSSDILL